MEEEVEGLKILVEGAGKFSEEEGILLQSAVVLRQCEKGEKLLVAGEICSSIYFLLHGSFIQYGFDSEMNRNVIDLSVDHDWLMNYRSFSSRNPSLYTIEAYENSTVYELTMESIHQLISTSPSFFQLGSILESSTSRVDFFDNKSTPDERYEWVLHHRPLLIQKFPQTLIASYLKMSPETFSRVRKRFSSHSSRS